VPADPAIWTVTDDWPEEVPVTEAEIDVFEAWFGDLFDELFSFESAVGCEMLGHASLSTSSPFWSG
jgi:hypothetical protein